MIRTDKDPTNYKLAYIAEYLSDHTADCTWLLWTNPTYEQLEKMGEAIGTDVCPFEDKEDIIRDLYDYVLQLEAE